MKLSKFVENHLSKNVNIVVAEQDHSLLHGKVALYESRKILIKNCKKIAILLEALPAKVGHESYTKAEINQRETLHPAVKSLLIDLINHGLAIHGLETTHSNPFIAINTHAGILEIAQELGFYQRLVASNLPHFEDLKLAAMIFYSLSKARIQRANQAFAETIAHFTPHKTVIAVCGVMHVTELRDAKKEQIDAGLLQRILANGIKATAVLAEYDSSIKWLNKAKNRIKKMMTTQKRHLTPCPHRAYISDSSLEELYSSISHS